MVLSPTHGLEPDGSWRPCGDYRRLNLVTVPDSYPLPNMLDFNERIAGCSIFSKVDLWKGYPDTDASGRYREDSHRQSLRAIRDPADDLWPAERREHLPATDGPPTGRAGLRFCLPG
jgi:hypothetical protein